MSLSDGFGARPAWAEVNLDNIAHNIRAIRKRVGPAVEIMAVVKADGYGHGAEHVATAALNSGATWLGVALVEEGVILRKAGIIAPILVLGALFPEQAKAALRYALSATVTTLDSVRALSLAATQEGRRAKVHVKVDTGMGRIGLVPEVAPGFVQDVLRFPNVEVEGLFTHLATADAEDVSFAGHQLELFRGVISRLESAGISIPFKHAANSAAVANHPEAYMDMVRPGIAIYGLSPSGTNYRWGEIRAKLGLRPAMSLKTRVAYVKPVPGETSIGYGRTYFTKDRTLVGTLPIGYADGLLRALSGKAEVLIRGKRYPLVGRICMDQVMVDLGPDSPVEAGDEAVLIGRQGSETITAEDVAEHAGTISYEVACAISRRVPRVYVSREHEPQ